MRTIVVALVVLLGCKPKPAPDKFVTARERMAVDFGHTAFTAWVKANPGWKCPASLRELTHYLANEDVKDPWGHDYVLLCDPAGIVSDGPDGKPDTPDDLRESFSLEQPVAAKPVPVPVDAAVVAAPPAVIDIAPLDLVEAYKDNEVGADEKYLGKVVRVAAPASKIGKDVLGDPYVLFHTSLGDLQAMVATGAGALKRGQKVTLRCTCKGLSLGQPILADCVIE